MHTARCGDGVVQAGVELCDDGNLNQKDAFNDCTLDAEMASSILVEECDDGNRAAICVEMIARARWATVPQPLTKNAIMVNSMVETADAARHACGHYLLVGRLRVLGDDAEINVPGHVWSPTEPLMKMVQPVGPYAMNHLT